MYFLFNRQETVLHLQFNMKKAAIIFLVFIYAVSSTGVALKADYCCDKLQSLKLVLSDFSKDKEGCCKEKYQSFKVKDTHAAADIVSTPALHISFIHALDYSFHTLELAYEKNNHGMSIHAPPLIASTPVYLSNCVFRI